MASEGPTGDGPVSPWPGHPYAPVAVLGALALAVVAPAMRLGTGFYMDDWGDLGRDRTLGVLRLAQIGKFASRPGAWSVETVTYGALGAHPLLWLILLTVLATAIATCIWLLLARFLPPWVALAVAGLWLLLPDHQSLRLFPNVTPITTSLLLVLLGLVLFERERPNLATLSWCMGVSCYESAYPPVVAGVAALHLLAGRGSRRQVAVAVGLATVTIAAMSIHPTYALSSARLGMPLSVIVGQLATGLTTSVAVSRVLLAVLGLALVVAIVQWPSADGLGRRGAVLMGAGLGVIAVGLSGFALRAPDSVRGIGDRAFGVSSVGTALLWVGALTVLARPPVARAAAALAFVVVLVAANIAFERDWSSVTSQTDRALVALDHRYHGHPPADLVIGPFPLNQGGVRSLHDLYIRDATLIVLGHSFRVTICESQAQWNATPARDRVTWTELLADRP